MCPCVCEWTQSEGPYLGSGESPAAEVPGLFVTVSCVVWGPMEARGQLEHHLSLDHMCLYDIADSN